jgi:hypothetical protein
MFLSSGRADGVPFPSVAGSAAALQGHGLAAEDAV